MGYIGRDGAYYNNYNDVRKSNARYDLLDKQNKLIEEQNRLLGSNQTNYSGNYNINYNDGGSWLDILAGCSILPIFLGLLALIALPGGWDAKLMGIRLLSGGLILPSICWAKAKPKYLRLQTCVIIVVIFGISLFIK